MEKTHKGRNNHLERFVNILESKQRGGIEKKDDFIHLSLHLKLFSIGFKMGNNIFIKHSEAVTFKSKCMQGKNFPP